MSEISTLRKGIYNRLYKLRRESSPRAESLANLKESLGIVELFYLIELESPIIIRRNVISEYRFSDDLLSCLTLREYDGHL